MENTAIKKVIVELENGNKLEFDKQVVLFAEDEMSNTEKAMSGDENTKICGVISCNPVFMSNVVESLLGSLKDAAPGLDSAVMMKHLEQTSDVKKMLDAIFG